MTTTATIKSAAANTTVERLIEAGMTVTGDRTGFTVTFDDLDIALAQVRSACDAAFRSYLSIGGNPRDKRSFTAQFAAVTKAITAASQSLRG